MFFCIICNKKLKNIFSFLSHLRWVHPGITTKNYYDKYLKKRNEEICQTPGCYNICNFYNLTLGYHKHCSRECTKKDPVVRIKFGTGNNNRKKARKTCLERYGVENVSQVREIHNKKLKTSLMNNGYPHWVGTKHHVEYMKNGGAAYCNLFIKNPSKPQIELFKRITNIFPYPILNYPEGKYSIDIAIPSINLAFEYDGSYWHKNIKYDNRRQKYLENNGWKVVRFIDVLPSIVELQQICKELII